VFCPSDVTCGDPIEAGGPLALLLLRRPRRAYAVILTGPDLASHPDLTGPDLASHPVIGGRPVIVSHPLLPRRPAPDRARRRGKRYRREG